MKIAIIVLLVCIAFGKGVELVDIVKVLVENGNTKDLGSLIKIVNKVFPDYFSVPSPKGTKIKSTLYQTCLYNKGPENNLCLNLDLTLTVGWTAKQFTDNLRIYNLTITPFADVSLDFNFTLNTLPISLGVNPYI